jgi:transposase
VQVLDAFYGVDVSKAKLDAARAGADSKQTFFNTANAIDAWLATLAPASAVAVESTGRYHRLFVERARSAGITVFVLNAKDVYFYAKGMGARAKTDRLDAQVIAQFLAERHKKLHPFVPARPSVEQVDQLQRQRALVVDKRAALRAALADCPIQAPMQLLEDGFKKALHQIDQQLQHLVSGDDQLRQDSELLETINGVGRQTSVLLAALFNKAQFASADAVVAFCGLDPRANDSGKKRGQRHLSKRGAPHLRRGLYLAAFGAARSKAVKPAYLALRTRGLAATEAFVVLARKILRVAFAVWKTRRPFEISKMGMFSVA